MRFRTFGVEKARFIPGTFVEDRRLLLDIVPAFETSETSGLDLSSCTIGRHPACGPLADICDTARALKGILQPRSGKHDNFRIHVAKRTSRCSIKYPSFKAANGCCNGHKKPPCVATALSAIAPTHALQLPLISTTELMIETRRAKMLSSSRASVQSLRR